MDQSINDFATEFGLDVAALLLSIIKYLVEDPTVISADVRHTLLTATDQEVDEALDAIRDDLLATRRKEAIQ